MKTKKTLFLALIVLATILTGFRPARGAEEGFSLVNQTGVELHKVYVGVHGSEDWEDSDELLLGRVLKQGQQLDVSFNSESGTPLWDLRVEDAAGNSLEFDGLNLSSANEVTLGADNKAYLK